jgi:hypothetical protein
MKAKNEDIESLCTPNSSKIDYFLEKIELFFLGGQPVLNPPDANYIFTQIAKLFCLMFHHEQSERTIQDESTEYKNRIFEFFFVF